jgi:hypothetical protein
VDSERQRAKAKSEAKKQPSTAPSGAPVRAKDGELVVRPVAEPVSLSALQHADAGSADAQKKKRKRKRKKKSTSEHSATSGSVSSVPSDGREFSLDPSSSDSSSLPHPTLPPESSPV